LEKIIEEKSLKEMDSRNLYRFEKEES